jgi:anti-anti-sigma factor
MSLTELKPSRGWELLKIELWGECDAVCVAPVGEIDLSTVDAVDDQLQQLLGDGARNLVLDLRQVTFMDSSGLRLVLCWNERADEQGIAFTVIQGPPEIARVFELGGVADQVRVRAA